MTLFAVNQNIILVKENILIGIWFWNYTCWDWFIFVDPFSIWQTAPKMQGKHVCKNYSVGGALPSHSTYPKEKHFLSSGNHQVDFPGL